MFHLNRNHGLLSIHKPRVLLILLIAVQGRVEVVYAAESRAPRAVALILRQTTGVPFSPLREPYCCACIRLNRGIPRDIIADGRWLKLTTALAIFPAAALGVNSLAAPSRRGNL